MNAVPLPSVELEQLKTHTGESLLALADQRPRLVVFLRHSGCTFCREALGDLKRQRGQIEAAGVGIVLVHQTADADAADFFRTYGLDDVPRIADPDLVAYRLFDLPQEKLHNLLHPKVWLRGMQAALLGGHGFGRVRGNVRQMPGVFVLDRGQVVAAFRHQLPSDRPDYAQMSCAVSGKP